jgi:hypothetical protein
MPEKEDSPTLVHANLETLGLDPESLSDLKCHSRHDFDTVLCRLVGGFPLRIGKNRDDFIVVVSNPINLGPEAHLHLLLSQYTLMLCHFQEIGEEFFDHL